MEILDVLDNAEKLQMKIIRYVWVHGGEVLLKDISKDLVISSVSLNKYFEEIIEASENIDSNIVWSIKDRKVVFTAPVELNLKHFYFYYLSNSLNYQIIMYMIRYEGVTMTKVYDSLSISESSLFRRLKDVNLFLEQFNIKIKNGKFEGEELNIRHFLFEFYWHVVPIDMYDRQMTDELISLFIDNLSEVIKLPIEGTNYYMMYLWLYICKERTKFHSESYLEKSGYDLLKEDDFYQKVDEASYDFSKRYKTPYYETDVLFLYGFLVSNYIFEEYQFETDHYLFTQKNYFQEVVELNKDTFNIINQYFNLNDMSDDIKWRIHYILFQTHFKLIYLNSSIVYYGEENFVKEEKNNSNRHLRHIALQMIEHHQNKYDLCISNSFKDILFWRYMTLLKVISTDTQPVLRVGLKLHMNYLVKMGIKHVLEESLLDDFNMEIEEAKERTFYDLLIIDNKKDIIKFEYMECYVMGTIVSEYYLNQLKGLLIHLVDDMIKI